MKPPPSRIRNKDSGKTFPGYQICGLFREVDACLDGAFAFRLIEGDREGGKDQHHATSWAWVAWVAMGHHPLGC